MKFIKGMRVVLLLTMLMAILLSCSKDDDNNTSVDDVTGTVKDGVWKVAYFSDSGMDKTADYEGYVFKFENNTLLLATKEINSHKGAWWVTESTSGDDFYSTIINVDFKAPDDLKLLTRSWKVIENTGTSLKLKDDSKGTSSIEYLYFEKL